MVALNAHVPRAALALVLKKAGFKREMRKKRHGKRHEKRRQSYFDRQKMGLSPKSGLFICLLIFFFLRINE